VTRARGRCSPTPLRYVGRHLPRSNPTRKRIPDPGPGLISALGLIVLATGMLNTAATAAVVIIAVIATVAGPWRRR
jgi:hypothetical protein